jgi:hypothetical protein
MRASSAPCGRGSKNQKISLHFSRASSPHPSAAKRKKKWKGNFWFCFAVSVSEKSNLILTFLFALFSALTATEAHPYPRLVVALTSANHTQPPQHSPLTSLALAASALCVFALWLRESVVVILNQYGLCYGTNKSVCACPTHPVRAQIPAVFRKYYKTAGIAPLTNHSSVYQTTINNFSAE